MTCLFLNKCLWIITEFIMHINWKVPVVAIKIQKQAYHGKWEVGIKLFQQTSKGFVNFNWRQSYSFIGFRAVRNTIQHSIFQQLSGMNGPLLYWCKVSQWHSCSFTPFPTPALKWKSISGHIWCDHCVWPPHFNHVQSFFLNALVWRRIYCTVLNLY